VRAVEIIQRQFQIDLAGVHLARVRVVFAVVFTALRCGQLSLTALGRAIAERTTHKHGIKRIDRLLGNARLHDEQLVFYRAIARKVIAAESAPLIIVDWTAVTPKLWALVAAVSFQGRALTIYAETHPISRYLKPYVNSAFLRRLKTVLPRGCQPIILADAGFRSPFMKLVERMGWDYVVRLRGPARIRHRYGRGWTRLGFLFGQTGARAKDFGRVEIGQRTRYVTRLVGIRRPVRHRGYHSRVRHGTVRWRERRAAHEPWILATSLALESPRIVALYARRMQIEETFRDAKSTRFGMSLGHARTRSPDRANVLLLLASLAHLFALLLGLAAEAARLHLGYQANTLATRRVLSLVRLGRLLVNSGHDALLASAVDDCAWSSFRARVAEGLSF
jgi:DDE family transposase